MRQKKLVVIAPSFIGGLTRGKQSPELNGALLVFINRDDDGLGHHNHVLHQGQIQKLPLLC
jgi:hypothetical protein